MSQILRDHPPAKTEISQKPSSGMVKSQNSSGDWAEGYPAGMEAARKCLAVLSLEMVATGKLSASQADELGELLAHDIRNYPLGWIEYAIQQHRKKSAFWPSLSDLMQWIQPRVEHERRMRRHEKRDKAWIADAPKVTGGGLKQLAAPEGFKVDPPGVREAAVSDWKANGAKELEALAKEAEQGRGGTKTSEKPKIDRRAKWHDADELRASMQRLKDAGLTEPPEA